MKFELTTEEHETLPHESLKCVDPNVVTLERVFDAKRQIRGLGEWIQEDIQKQVFVNLIPKRDDECFGGGSGISVTGSTIQFDLEQAVQLAVGELRALSGYGPFTLWIKGRRYGTWELDVEYSCSSDIYHAIDDDMGLGPEEWFGR